METIFFQSGVTGKADIGLRFQDIAGDWVGARITAGVFETDALVGTYGVTVAIPATAKLVHWDSLGTPAINGDEVFDRVGYATLSASLSGLGTGAYPITITVKDDQGSPAVIPSATVRLTQGALTYSGTTDASGNITFSLDAATDYLVSITKGGYSFTPVTRTVTGSQAGTLVSVLTMVTTVGVSNPSTPELCTLYGTLFKPDGTKAVNVPVVATIVVPREAPVEAGGGLGGIISGRSAEATTNSVGYFSMDLVRTDAMTPDGVTYTVVCVAAGLNRKRVTLVAGTKNVATLIPV